VATTKDFQTIEEKHLVTRFNSKAMGLFPERINGKMAAVLTVDTDNPPAKIALAFFDEEKDIWSEEYWDNWRLSLETFRLPLRREAEDHVEVGAAPVKTAAGWLLVYSYIRGYFSSHKIFGIEAVLLDEDNPLRIIGKTKEPLLVPQEEYELYGKVPHVIFPSGALVQEEDLNIYYGAADTRCCLAKVNIDTLTEQMKRYGKGIVYVGEKKKVRLKREEENPIIEPKYDHDWESKYTFNPGAIYDGEKVHILYRAMGKDDTSVIGYASSKDGVHLDERLDEPIYTPRKEFEKKLKPGFSGCEDARIIELDKRYYITYTAFNGRDRWRIALSSIKTKDFKQKKWNWEEPKLISPPGVGDKDSSLFPEKFNGRYAIFHRIEPCIWLDFEDDLKFGKDDWVEGQIIMQPRTDKWDNKKIGIGGQPIKTEEGWLLIYHGVTNQDDNYRMGAALLKLDDPTKVIARLDYPILEPRAVYEHRGYRPGTVFGCGNVVIDEEVYVYYGAADQFVGVARVGLQELLKELKKYRVGRFIS
jgi:predicted GH43/DUF377 family glycosyl hydrolase